MRSASRCGNDSVVRQPLLFPEPAVLQAEQLLHVRRLEPARTRVIYEARRDAVVAEPDDLLQREILEPELFHVRDELGADAVVPRPHDVLERDVLEALRREIA